MKKRIISLIIGAVLITGLLTACRGTSSESVSVQSVALICGLGNLGNAERFAGIVVPQREVKIEKDSSRKIKERLVNEGDQIKIGDVLFTYDEDAAKLELDKARLQAEQLKNTIDSLTARKNTLIQEKANAPADQQLSYTIEIQSAEADLMEANYNLEAKNKEIQNMESSLEESEVKSTINGVVQSVSESGTDSSGNQVPYMTLMETGAFRVKGSINETNFNALKVGDQVIIRSRTDNSATWKGKVQLIESENPDSSGGSNYYGGAVSEFTSSSKYPFYVEITDPTGLMLGQHVYIEAGEGVTAAAEIKIPDYFIMDADTSPWVWAAKNDKLKKVKITLGEHDDAAASYVVTAGLTVTDYLAYPEDSLKEGLSVTYYSEENFADDTDDEGNADDVLPDDGSITDDEAINYDEGYNADGDMAYPEEAEGETEEAGDEGIMPRGGEAVPETTATPR
ncbi:MAG: efflux RND transporter periplasmic adaptor subunit [Parasporobacterium sp.]|nr:efflux RND transporter periplasmic adaptor subunit [Parasporobacterium sp.]